jgi:hypothetical protein
MGTGYRKQKRAARRRDHLDAARAAAAAEEYQVAAEILRRGHLRLCCICVERDAKGAVEVAGPVRCRGKKLPFCKSCRAEHLRPLLGVDPGFSSGGTFGGLVIELGWRQRLRDQAKPSRFGRHYGTDVMYRPPIQNIPIQSSAPDARPGRRTSAALRAFASVDYASLEHRVLAHLHDEILIEIKP